jgi:hypothetical protein
MRILIGRQSFLDPHRNTNTDERREELVKKTIFHYLTAKGDAQLII